jgi:hypothetical protein
LNLIPAYSQGGHQSVGWARHGALLNLEPYGAVMKQLNELEVAMVAGGESTSDRAEIAAFFEAQRKQRQEELARLARNAMN